MGDAPTRTELNTLDEELTHTCIGNRGQSCDCLACRCRAALDGLWHDLVDARERLDEAAYALDRYQRRDQW